MHQDLLHQSPLLALPIAATFVFVAVWAGQAMRVMTRSRQEMTARARMPLESESPHERR